jgi:uroporphyrinogen-III decarboxylase
MKTLLIALCFVAASPALAESTRDRELREFAESIDRQETQQNLKNIADEIRQLREEQEHNAPLINGGR